MPHSAALMVTGITQEKKVLKIHDTNPQSAHLHEFRVEMI